MRITTPTYFRTALNGIEQQQSDVSKLTQELATGKKVNSPSDNPTAFANAQRLQSHVQSLNQYATDNANLKNQLGLGSQTLNQSLTVLNSVRSVALQAANGTANSQNRAALAKQVESAKTQLLGLANTKAGNGAYLFGGSRGQAAPFFKKPNGTVEYRGDGAAQQTHTAQNQSVNSLLTGSVFAETYNGNGYANITAASGNTGNATANLNGITNQGAATTFRESGTPYKISFKTVSGNMNYFVKQGGTTVTSGAYQKGMSLNLSGISVKLNGSPNTGDSFTLGRSQHQSVFKTLDNLISALKKPVNTAAENAKNTQRINSVLSSLKQSQTHVLSLQSTVGVAMRSINDTNNTNATQKNNDQSAISSAIDANVPKVLTALDQHKQSLISAMGAFGKLSKLSLFNYI